ncbi:murein biosynthesis integral membrane protein MurJ [Niallia circulans]|uniref:Murein biosynthesis integral membrane protein MurJ n=1 Tax=Niallia circulans TaxID=1397 RepID=A0A941GJM8_NIACI|nr:murein biosynthesis integral membrane protein MurJ [Niallia circulans]MCB5237686.1 murein biosynthesis integral membrane protein MurJ [Niallia circulans]
MKEKIKIITILVMLLTVISKLTGFFREQIIALKYGASGTADIFMTALSLPLYISNILGGIIISVFIPLFVEIKNTNGLVKAKEFTNQLFTFLTLFLLSVVILLMVNNNLLEKILFGELLEFNILLYILPVAFLMSVAIFYTAYLNANKRYLLPQFATVLMNIVFIAIVYIFSSKLSYLLFASIISSAFQLIFLWIMIMREGHNFKVNFKIDHNIKRFMILGFPIFLGSMSVQSFTVFDKLLAKDLIEGSISSLAYAQKLTQLPMGVIATTISTIMFSKLAEYVAKQEIGEIDNSLFSGIKNTLLITLPIVLVFYFYSESITKFVYGRGEFDFHAINMTSSAIKMYSIGILGSSLTMIISRYFLSYKRVNITVVSNILAAIINLLLALFLVKGYGHLGLALANSISCIFNFLFLLVIYLSEKQRTNILKSYLKLSLQFIIITFILCLIMYFLNFYIVSNMSLILIIILSICIYGILSFIFRVVSLKELRS